MQHFDKWRRMLVNIDKSLYNEVVSNLLTKHYLLLYKMLVKSELDEDIFNDTYLKLTYNYNPDSDFILLYLYYFNLLKGAYYRDDKVTNYLVVAIDDKDYPDVEEPEPIITNNANFIETLKAEILDI